MDVKRRDELRPQKNLIFTIKDDTPKSKFFTFTLQSGELKLYDGLKCVANPASLFKPVKSKQF